MDNIKVLKCLTRLAQISEQIEDTNPQAADMIDQTIDDASKANKPTPTVDPNLFPPVATPTLQQAPEEKKNDLTNQVNQLEEDQSIEHKDANELAQSISQDIKNSTEFQQLMPMLTQDGGEEQLSQLINKKIDEIMGEPHDEFEDNSPSSKNFYF